LTKVLRIWYNKLKSQLAIKKGVVNKKEQVHLREECKAKDLPMTRLLRLRLAMTLLSFDTPRLLPPY